MGEINVVQLRKGTTFISCVSHARLTLIHCTFLKAQKSFSDQKVSAIYRRRCHCRRRKLFAFSSFSLKHHWANFNKNQYKALFVKIIENYRVYVLLVFFETISSQKLFDKKSCIFCGSTLRQCRFQFGQSLFLGGKVGLQFRVRIFLYVGIY